MLLKTQVTSDAQHFIKCMENKLCNWSFKVFVNLLSLWMNFDHFHKVKDKYQGDPIKRYNTYCVHPLKWYHWKTNCPAVLIHMHPWHAEIVPPTMCIKAYMCKSHLLENALLIKQTNPKVVKIIFLVIKLFSFKFSITFQSEV